MEKPGIEPATPGLQGIGLSPTPWRLLMYKIYKIYLNSIVRIESDSAEIIIE